MSRNITANVFSPTKEPVSIVIPTANYRHRLKHAGVRSLVEVAPNVTLLDHQIKCIYTHFYNPEIILVTGYEEEKVKASLPTKSKIKTVHNANWEQSNVFASLRLGMSVATHPRVLWIYGDLLFNHFMLRAPFSNYSMVLIDRYGAMKSNLGCIEHEQYAENFMYDIPNTWAQIAYFTGKELELLHTLSKETNNQSCYGFEALNHIIRQGGKFSVFSPKNGKITDLDDKEDLYNCRAFYENFCK